MKRGYLSQYFDGVAFKILSVVEANELSSNQHEFNGVDYLKKILGKPLDRVRYSSQFMYLTDFEDNPLIESGFLTWYDARKKAREERGVMRSEYRLYFSENQVLNNANEGDILIIAKLKNSTLLAIVAEKDTTIANQLLWLFGFSDEFVPKFSVREELETDQDRIEFTSRFILENIGIEVEVESDNFLDNMLEKFGGKFPSTKEFSNFARSTLPDYKADLEHSDEILMAWLEREEILFRTLERYLISERLSRGFSDDIEGFISYSLGVQNRRKSRAGLSLENHLETMFESLDIKCSRTPVTENKSKPDFLFPGIKYYRDMSFNPAYLTMLGVKTTCKDRWRQVLSEAKRVTDKHLFTLEPAISTNQTAEMQAHRLQLVLPKSLHETYNKDQQSWLMDLSQFIRLVKSRQTIDRI